MVREAEERRSLEEAIRTVRVSLKRKLEWEESVAPECPLCMVLMTPPKQIYQCPEGHLVCSDCRPQVSRAGKSSKWAPNFSFHM